MLPRSRHTQSRVCFNSPTCRPSSTKTAFDWRMSCAMRAALAGPLRIASNSSNTARTGVAAKAFERNATSSSSLAL